MARYLKKKNINDFRVNEDAMGNVQVKLNSQIYIFSFCLAGMQDINVQLLRCTLAAS